MHFSHVSPFCYRFRVKRFVVGIRNKEAQPIAVSTLMPFVTHPEL